MADPLKKLIQGYRDFRHDYVGTNYAAYRIWASGAQDPRIMMISCSDSRVNPSILTHAGLGDLFNVQNVANLVPPYKQGQNSHHSTSAALEYAVTVLGVAHIIIMGHSGCGGIKALMQGNLPETGIMADGSYSFIGPWVHIADQAKQQVLQQYPDAKPDEQLKICEKQSVLISLKNLTSFPFIETAINTNKLKIHAWFFEISSGDILAYDHKSEKFEALQ